MIFSLFGGKPKAPNYTVYVKDGDIYLNNLNGKESIELSSKVEDNVVGAITMSADGKTIFFPKKGDRDEFDLYYRSATKKNADDEKIASNVSRYLVSEDGKLVIYKNDKGLYESNLKDDEKIESDVETFWASADCKTVIYTTGDDKLYVKKHGKDEEKLDSDVQRINKITENGSTVFYTKDGELYKRVIKKKDEERISKDVLQAVVFYDDGTGYYLTGEDTSVSLMDYMEDDMADSDAAMTEPVSPTRPNRFDYEWPNYNDYEWPQIDYSAYETYEEAWDAYEQAKAVVQAQYDAD